VKKRWITVRPGSPVGVHLEDGSPLRSGDLEEGTFRCSIQILGLDRDEGVYAPFGEDPFVALQFAIDLIGDLFQKGCDRLNLENKYRVAPSTREHWIWRYPSQKGGKGGEKGTA
jgi:hypothetical protein